ncbi:Ig-like domain-containing protein [Microlunatus parietis]|uniref:Bacterial Ig-like domain-containing protein n=1 Tax=Microlunatus parietis TaxID=682979 RepID=A0A7Y9I3G0_9ACTN|nr:Ig-like domain-containing protein [Microlunatus parietis]NYE69517.1 hypothetical protein [Microlunatus parietis]
MRTVPQRLGLVPILIALALVLGTAPASAEPVRPGPAAELPARFAEPENLGPLIRSVAVFDSAYGVENGRDVLYTTVTGSPATFQVIDLDSHTLLRTIPLPGAADSWSHAVDHDGSVIISGGGHLFRYQPSDATVRDLGRAPGASVLYGVSPDGAGNVYAGTYPDGKVIKYDSAAGTFTDFGSVVPGQDYVRGLAYHRGTVYAGVGITGSLWSIDPGTGAKTEIPLPARPEFDPARPPSIYSLNTAGDLLFVQLSDVNLLLIYDTVAGAWLDTAVSQYRGLYTSPERDGKTFLVAGGRLRSFDLATHELVDTGIAFGTYLRHSAWVDVSATNPELPGLSLVTVQYGGAVSFLNPQTGRVISKPSILEGSPITLQTLERGPDDRLYASGYPGGTGARFDPEGGGLTNFALGQSEGMATLGDSLYLGNYPGAIMHELDTTKPLGAGTNPRQAHDIGDDQDRPFAITAGDGKLFVGTIPTYGALGGAVTIKDGAVWSTYRNVVPGQSVMSLAYRDGKLYGSTTVWGGLGIEPTETVARVFVFDVATRTVEKIITPELPGAVTAKAIGALSFGPDGLLWGAAWGTIFALDPATLEVVRSREIVATDWNFNHLWRPIQLRWAADGLLYTTLGGNLTVVEPRSLKSRTLAATALMTLAANGDVYYADGPDLIRIRDITAPDAPTVSAPARPGPSADDTPEVSVRSEAGALIQLWNGDQEVGRDTAGSDGAATVVAGPLADGTYRLRVTATDAAGNRSQPADVPLIVVR